MTSPSERTASVTRRVVLVVPCYNESSRLDVSEFERVLETKEELGFVFVDDGSTDGTLLVLQRLELSDARCAVLVLPRNAGKAEAVRAGLLHALAGRAEYVGYWDADLATPLDVVGSFAAVLDERPQCQAVLGARVRLLGRRVERRAVRHYLGRVFATAASVALMMPVYDTQCGAKLFRASPHLRAILSAPFLSRWAFDVELIARLREALGTHDVDEGFCELPLVAWRDVPGSKLRLASAIRSALELLRIAVRSRRGRAARAPRVHRQATIN
jgi:glycosyltransferase involved in cell wall biosynthesis